MLATQHDRHNAALTANKIGKSRFYALDASDWIGCNDSNVSRVSHP
jgi:hypothetical protein